MRTVLTSSRLALLGAAVTLLAAGTHARADSGSSAPAQAPDSAPPNVPGAPRVFHAPTAWLQPAGGVFATGGANHRGGMFVAATAGLGGLAEVDVAMTDHVIACSVCDGEQRETVEMYIPTAEFKVGLAQGRFARWQPAVALGYRRSLGAIDRDAGGIPFDPELAHMYLVMSLRVSRLELHAGGEMWDATSRPDGPALHEAPIADQLRAFGAASWRLQRYPRTTVMLDFAWAPELTDPAPRLAWLAGFGVRYQALAWASVELGVRGRERETENLNLTAFLRLNAALR